MGRGGDTGVRCRFLGRDASGVCTLPAAFEFLTSGDRVVEFAVL